jgi:ferric-dicitrate binding protein FerR (iron transport regulator)
MTGTRDQPRSYELFLRYWDNALTDEEAAELNRLLLEDPASLEAFSDFVTQVVALNEYQEVSRPISPLPTPSELESLHAKPTLLTADRPRWSRRQVLGWSGLAVGAAASIVIGARAWMSDSEPAPHRGVTLASASGTVRIGDRTARSGEELLPGEMIATVGPNSSATLIYADGSAIVLTGDTAIALTEQGRELVLQEGVATADIHKQVAGAEPLTLATGQVTLAGLNAVMMTLAQVLQTTEVEVYQGRVTVEAHTGKRLVDVQGGEMLTISADGDHKKKPIPPTPDEFSWDLSRPLPVGWHIGHREVTAEGPVIRPEFWFDPYHQAEMSQIRSNQQWARGFFRLFPESVVRVRYRVDQPGPSQMCFCVRTGDARSGSTGMLECNGAFARARPGEWQWLEVRGADMLANPHTPTFGPPWVGFLVIFNTYRVDLGLVVAEFQVTRPGRLD